MNRKKYDIEYLKNNLNLNRNISFEYQNSFATIGVTEILIGRNRCLKFYIALDENFDEMEYLYFDAIDELFETVSIEGHILKDIWEDVEITCISDFSKSSKSPKSIELS